MHSINLVCRKPYHFNYFHSVFSAQGTFVTYLCTGPVADGPGSIFPEQQQTGPNEDGRGGPKKTGLCRPLYHPLWVCVPTMGLFNPLMILWTTMGLGTPLCLCTPIIGLCTSLWAYGLYNGPGICPSRRACMYTLVTCLCCTDTDKNSSDWWYEQWTNEQSLTWQLLTVDNVRYHSEHSCQSTTAMWYWQLWNITHTYIHHL